MHVTVRNRSDKVVCSLEIVPDSNGDTSTSDNLASVLDLKREFQRSVSGLRLERLRFYLQDGKTLLDVRILKKSSTLSSMNRRS